jgi:NAD(P) transhydrogenase subunit alpha
MPLITEITIFVLAAFVGFEVISKVPTTLHTPLMSQTNAIHGIVLLGGLIVVGLSDFWLDNLIGTIAIFFGTINIVGGFMVTDRMLGMFVRKPKPPASSASSEPEASDQPAKPAAGAGGSDEGRSSGDSEDPEKDG